MAIYGYARVSTASQTLGAQKEALKQAGVKSGNIYSEKYTGSTTHRPVFEKLMNTLKAGDTLVVTKLDRLARNTREGLKTIEELLEKEININVLNMGVIENTPVGKLIYTVLSAVADMEREMILERTQAGKEFAKKNNPSYREGRPRRKLTKRYLDAIEMLKTDTYKNVSERTEISISTLQRIKKQYEKELEINEK